MVPARQIYNRHERLTPIDAHSLDSPITGKPAMLTGVQHGSSKKISIMGWNDFLISFLHSYAIVIRPSTIVVRGLIQTKTCKPHTPIWLPTLKEP